MSARELRLTGAEMEAVLASIKEDAGQGFVQAWDTILRHTGTTWDEADSINPTEFAIPEGQWLEISEALLVHGMDWALTWMNKGPSGY